MMMTTHFFNSTQNSVMLGLNGQSSAQSNNSRPGGTSGSVQNSKTIAQAKLRKQRANRGASNPMQFDHNGLNSQDYSILNTSTNHGRQQSL